jgi:glutamate dehydrogenase/leucine dehydrogenase
MTYKCALAGMPHGGGKGVIIGDPKKDKNKTLLKTYARKVDELRGEFYTGEDVGISEEDVQYMLTISPHFIGKRGQAGDPSPFASLSTFYAMEAAVKREFGRAGLQGKRVAIKGVGKVGSELARLLCESGALVYIADADPQAIAKTKSLAPNVEVVNVEQIREAEVDVYAPCALGSEFTSKNCKRVKAKIICGAANNQLTKPSIGNCLYEKGIIYIPDYVANSGGLINVADELNAGGYNYKRVVKRIKAVEKTVEHLFEMSEEVNEPLNIVADELARELFEHNHNYV